MLTVHPPDQDGNRRWELDDQATLYDVTHLAYPSEHYIPTTVDVSCSPANAQKSAFPVAPGGVMSTVESYQKQNYTMLFVITVSVEDEGR